MKRAADKAGTAESGGTAPGVSSHVSRIAEYLVAAKGDADKGDAEVPDLGQFIIGSTELAAALAAPTGWSKRGSLAAVGSSLLLHGALVLALMPAAAKSKFGVGGTELESVAVEVVSSQALESALLALAAASTGSLGALAEQSGVTAAVPESEADPARPAPKPELVTPRSEAQLRPEETIRDPDQAAALTPGTEARDAPDPTLEKPEPARPAEPTETMKDEGKDTARQVAMMPVPAGGATSLGASEAPSDAAAGASQGAAMRYALEVRIALGKALGRAGPQLIGRRGKVVVGFGLSATGGVAMVGIVQSSGNATLDEAALTIVRGTRFPTPPPGMSTAQLHYTQPFDFR